MNIIRLLSEKIANQIAAGEVIQRPASAVKELLENAIDAGATEVKVSIKDAGRTSIFIQDNGKGMTPEDALMSFKRHSTSKLNKVDDLFTLSTKGFRGEALASIAAISQVIMKTKHADAESNGYLVEYSGGELVESEECVCDLGTSIEVKNIFFNVPARRNFLKSNSVEFTHIRHEFERIALAHGEVKLILVQNGTEIYNLAPGNLRKRITDILGKNSNEKLVPISEETEIVSIHGFVGKPEFAKRTRGEQYFFVNNRFFKHPYFHHAITKAFENLVPEQTFPSYFVFLEIDSTKIDINVHPTKTEITFEESKFIYSILLSSVKQALGKYNIAPSLDFDVDSSIQIPTSDNPAEVKEPEIKVNSDYNPFTSFEKKDISYDSKSSALHKQGFGQNPDPEDWQHFYQIKEGEDKGVDKELIEETSMADSLQQFLIRGKYIIANAKSGLLLIDSKRAQERILYDEIMQQFVSNPVESQKMLFPMQIPFNKDEISAWTNTSSLLNQLGFGFSVEGNELSVEQIPSCLQDSDASECIQCITSALMGAEAEKGELAHEIVAAMVHSRNYQLSFGSNIETKNFIERVFSSKDHAFCPKGKPIMQTVTLEELTSNF